MTNSDDQGYRVGSDARLVLHRSGRDHRYSVAVVLDEGPYTLEQAALRLDEIREQVGGYVTRAVAAQRLGLTERMIDVMRTAGVLDWKADDTKRVMISVDSLKKELQRRVEKKAS